MLAILSLLLCPPPAGTAACVRDLGAYSFRVREAASVRLHALGERAARVALGSRDPEVRHRARMVLDALEAEQWRVLGPMPMVDALWYDRAVREYMDGTALRRLYGELASPHRDGRRYPDDPWQWGYLTAGTRELIEDWRAAGMPWWLLRAVLAEMRRRDAAFLRRHHGGQWPGRKPPPRPSRSRAPVPSLKLLSGIHL